MTDLIDTEMLIKRRGYCFWKCATLNGDIIAIIKDRELSELDKDNLKEAINKLARKGKYCQATYKLAELANLTGTNMMGIHELKKQGAIIETEDE